MDIVLQIHNIWVELQYEMGIFNISNYFFRYITQTALLTVVYSIIALCVIAILSIVIYCALKVCDLYLKKKMNFHGILNCEELLNINSNNSNELLIKYDVVKREITTLRRKKLTRIIVSITISIFMLRMAAWGLDSLFSLGDGTILNTIALFKRYVWGIVCGIVYLIIFIVVCVFISRRKVVTFGTVIKSKR